MSDSPSDKRPDYGVIAKAAKKLGLVGKNYTRKNLSRGQKSALTKIYNKNKDVYANVFKTPDAYHIHKVSKKSADRLKEAEFKVINSRVIIKKRGKNEGLRIRTLKTQTDIYTYRKERGKRFVRNEAHFTPVFDDPLRVYKQLDDFERLIARLGNDPEQLAASGSPYPYLQVSIAGYMSRPFDSISDARLYLSKFSTQSLRYITLVKRTWSEVEDDEGDY